MYRSVFSSLNIQLSKSIYPPFSGSLSGLASQVTARQGRIKRSEDENTPLTVSTGNALGMLGVGSGILASLAAVGFPAPVLAQFAGVAGIGGLIGTIVGRLVFRTDAFPHFI
jgi:NAD(P) transhydrogenase